MCTEKICLQLLLLYGTVGFDCDALAVECYRCAVWLCTTDQNSIVIGIEMKINVTLLISCKRTRHLKKRLTINLCILIIRHSYENFGLDFISAIISVTISRISGLKKL